MPMLSRRVLIAVSTVVVMTGCGAEAEPTRSAARFVTTTAVLASPDVTGQEKDEAREVRQDLERARLVEVVRVAADAKAAEDARVAAAAAQVAAEAAAQAVAAERAAAERVAADVAAAARAARTRTPVAVPAPAPARASRPAPVAAPRAAAPAAPRVAPAAPAPVAAAAGQGGYEGEVLALTNAERARAGLRPLQSSGCAQQYARTWSQRLADTGSLSHQPLGPVMSGCGARGAAENVAFGNISAAQMVSNWMNSPGHRANILNPNYTHLGVGMVERSDGRRYGTQVFLTL